MLTFEGQVMQDQKNRRIQNNLSAGRDLNLWSIQAHIQHHGTDTETWTISVQVKTNPSCFAKVKHQLVLTLMTSKIR